ncbi:MAG TPA: GNAT family N-acetyltransferase [Gaiellaceae bacterium]|jgi:ribosomal protein S18 acetylase RimI-like enzyme|nr:GNAT family N-acetyltransferase [Gaiellaceae bacterium]
MDVQLRPMRDEEFADWLPRMRDDYGQAMIDEAGIPPEGAREKAAADIEQLFPDGRPSDEQLVFVIEADGEPVGELWLADRDVLGQRSLFIYDVHVAEPQRGRGLGKAAMLLAEDEARRRGIDRLALNVFGRNTVARRLYQSLGYEENAIAMSKSLDQD